MQICQSVRRHLFKHTRESVLPFITVTKEGELQRRAIEQYKTQSDDCFLFLHVVSNLSVSMNQSKAVKILTL